MTQCDSNRRRTSATRLAAVFVVVLVAVVIVAASTPVTAGQGQSGNQRPLSDWLSQQGTTSVFFPPVPDLVGWANGDDPPVQPPRFALADYAGVFAAYIRSVNSAIDLGTTVSGTVTERPLADGRAMVHVNIRTKNALTWVYDISQSFPGELILGSSALDVLDGQPPALGETHLDVIFTNTAPGAPLPNLVRAMGNLCFESDDHPVADCPPAGVEVVDLRFSAQVTGPLHAAFGVPEGTRARFMTSQTGFQVTTCTLDPSHAKLVGPQATADCFPVETMFIQVLGH
jgi:hypothetical protein